MLKKGLVFISFITTKKLSMPRSAALVFAQAAQHATPVTSAARISIVMSVFLEI
jgi:hypothetical protein